MFYISHLSENRWRRCRAANKNENITYYLPCVRIFVSLFFSFSKVVKMFSAGAGNKKKRRHTKLIELATVSYAPPRRPSRDWRWANRVDRGEGVRLSLISPATGTCFTGPVCGNSTIQQFNSSRKHGAEIIHRCQAVLI